MYQSLRVLIDGGSTRFANFDLELTNTCMIQLEHEMKNVTSKANKHRLIEERIYKMMLIKEYNHFQEQAEF